jgi:hypothetical protein
VARIGSVGSPPKGKHSKSNLFIMRLIPLVGFLSLGRAYGKIRRLREWSFFVWTAALGRILTLDNLRKRHIIVMDWYCMCKNSGESIDHLLLYCGVARELWVSSFFSGRVGNAQSVVELLASWSGQFGSHCNLEAWRMAPHCVMWCIWRERNS